MAIRIDRQSTSIRRRQIIDAARDLITSKGMESVTIDAIAEAVGVTEGAIYRHFQSKREILSMLIDNIEESLMGTSAALAWRGRPRRRTWNASWRHTSATWRAAAPSPSSS